MIPPQASSLALAVPVVTAALGGDFLRAQRWFGAKSRPVQGVTAEDWLWLTPQAAADPLALVIARVNFADCGQDLYLLPLAFSKGGDGGAVATVVSTPDGDYGVEDATRLPGFHTALYAAIARGGRLETTRGRQVSFSVTRALREQAEAHDPLERTSLLERAQGQSNSSIIYGEAFILKLFRRLEAGVNPDLEVLRFLTERTSFRDVPRLAASIEYHQPGLEAISLAALQCFAPNQGGAWEDFLARLMAGLQAHAAHASHPDEAAHAIGLDEAAHAIGLDEAVLTLGKVTRGLHVALASDASDPDFAPEAVTPQDAQAWRQVLEAEIEATLTALSERRTTLPPAWRAGLDRLMAAGAAMKAMAAGFGGAVGREKTRHHGDYHLGQVLKTVDGFVVLDFEGEPSRPLRERRAKLLALKDVAGMLRSLSYVAASALEALPDARRAALTPLAEAWRERAQALFLEGYAGTGGGAALARDPILRALTLEKALYELRYELDNRPAWLGVPLSGILQVLDAG